MRPFRRHLRVMAYCLSLLFVWAAVWTPTRAMAQVVAGSPFGGFSVGGDFTTLNTSTTFALNTRSAVTVDSAATFAAASSYTLLACTGAESISTITGGRTGMLLVIENTDTECTLVDDDAPTATDALNLVGTATNDVGATAKFLTLIYDGTSWQQTGESANN